MKNLLARLKGFFTSHRHPPLTEEDEDRLRATFRARYHDFKQLLAANTRALEIMADMETALDGGDVFGMAFVRGRSTAIATRVYKMIKHLDALAPNRYRELFDSFRKIQSEMDISIRRAPFPMQEELILDLDGVGRDLTDEVGEKMANLGEVRNRVGLPTPAGFAITASAYRAFFRHNGLQEEIDRRVQATMPNTTGKLFEVSTSIQQLVTEAEVPHEIRQAITEAHERLQEQSREDVRVAMRSSGLGEDAAQSSFAGQYLSRLNLGRDELADAYKDVVASKYSAQAMHYRYRRGLRDADMAMCVGCLAMVDAVCGGVAYSVNPVDHGDRNIQITAALGLPKGVVEGDVPADLYMVSRTGDNPVADRKIEHKTVQHRSRSDGGEERVDVEPARADAPTLTDGQASELTRMVLAMETHYGSARDVEWALDRNGSFVILQCRPLSQQQGVGTSSPARKHQGRALVSGGTTASPGVAFGPIRWVRSAADAEGFTRGSVLALSRPEPRWAALLGKAVAVVAREGTLEGHLATVSREYGLPALFHLDDAIEVLEDGTEITVDADEHAIYPGRDEPSLTRALSRINLMKDSPVYLTLVDVLKHVSPLTLINPDSPDFTPSRCRTLHDITRFCHEKSVKEMFDFGKRFHFPERSAKQLFYKVPMHYWVIDLDDGFREEVEGKYVHIDNIVCRPMRALSAGFAAVPWEGPPALSGKGFASIMFEATTNPELGVHLKSPVSDKTYFMISRHYMNVQSRLGFHFATVEALVGERDKENYAAFSFSGGAASQDRRVARARFISEIIEEREFTVKITGDTLRARIEGLDEKRMLQKLRILGYLVMHTRQLDMIMDKPKLVARYGRKIRQDLDGL